ncbi:HAD family hydrolase [Calycomorphotria hydatis]|uniref:phosphoglycolate phosphatase n=1 Tax=Calycomorphotria hydatis TaxID=2528027 RepID=A0A517T6Y9_9PLAN|nr:HAD family hydrolase [Calycomorphotria hydatis]QDT64142.1 5'-nucleotidase [Calycomorphotria hydatis]
MHICLFDIDGTLLNTGGAGAKAMESAVHEVFNRNEAIFDIPFAGRTDRAIVHDIFQYYGIEFSEENVREFLNRYVTHLRELLSACEGLVLPGVPEILAHLHERDDVLLGLLTGNFIEGAKYKLSHYGLDRYFDFAIGGFGDAHHDRDDVAKAAFDTVKAHRHPEDIDIEKLWVIGDTPADIQCARAIGAKVVAVGTGIFSAEELAAHDPDYLADNFGDVEPILNLWTSFS